MAKEVNDRMANPRNYQINANENEEPLPHTDQNGYYQKPRNNNNNKEFACIYIKKVNTCVISVGM